MKLKTLFLGTAAAFAISGGAQAADLALAVEPIDYVKVCDAFGTGYAYIPGTDVCLKIGGYAQMDIWFYDSDEARNYADISSVLQDAPAQLQDNPLQPSNAVASYLYAQDDYQAGWEFKSEYGVNFTAKSMSDLGPIVTFFEFRGKSENDDLGGAYRNAYLDSGYGAIGPVMFGYTTSTFDPGGGYTYDGSIRSDETVDQVRLSYLMGTWGIMLGLEDPRDRFKENIALTTGDYPDIVLALTGGLGGFDVKVAGAVTDRIDGTGWALMAMGEAELGIAKIKVTGAYTDNAATYAGGVATCLAAVIGNNGNCDLGVVWSAYISGQIDLSANVYTAATFSYINVEGNKNVVSNEAYAAAVGIYYAPSSASHIGLEFLYEDSDNGSDSWGIHNRWKTSF